MSIQTKEQFVAVYEDDYADVLRYVQRRFDPAGVDDVVSETFTIAWRRRESLPESVRPWLFKTASHLMKSFQRSTIGHERWAAIDLAPPPELSAEDVLDLKAAWRSMGSRDREVLALKYWEDLTDSEGAEVLKCTRATFSMRLARAKRRFRDAMPMSAPEPTHLKDTSPTLEGTA